MKAGYVCSITNDSTLVEQEDSRFSYVLQGQSLVSKNGALVERKWQKTPQVQTPLTAWSGSYYCKDIEHTLELVVQDSVLTSNTPFMTHLQPIGNGLFMDTATRSLVKFQHQQAFTLHIPQGDRNLRHLAFRRTK